MTEHTMNRFLLATIVLMSAIATTSSLAQSTSNIVITRAAARPWRVAPAENFTGTVRVQTLFGTTDSTRAYGASVSFEAGARTAWHTHPRGQVLIVTEGIGRVQRWGAPVEEIRGGDVAWIPPGVKHWHGATDTTSVKHIAIQQYEDGQNVLWMEPVTDEQYVGDTE